MSNRGRSDGSGMINNVNVFAALSSSRKKKSKGKSSSSAAKSGVEKATVVEEKFWAPAPLNVKSWADVDDEDDDDYYATTAPPQAVWGLSDQKQAKEESLVHVEESDSEEDVLGEGDNDLDEEQDSEPDDQEDPKPVVKSFAPAIAVKEPEKQLSKKEIRKKELEELDALLADLNITPGDKNGLDKPQGAEADEKESQPIGEEETGGSGHAESKNSKKKKKKVKSSKESKDIQSHLAQEEANAEEDTSTIDVKEQLKKLAASKKKKPSKETDTIAKAAAAAEAAARRQKLEAAKKKEKTHHYNQQPMR